MCIFAGIFLGVMPLSNIEFWPKLNIVLKQFVISKLLNRILRNFVVDKDKLCTCAHLQENFIWLFSKRTAIRTLAKTYPVLFRASCVKWNWFSRNNREAVQSDIFLTVNPNVTQMRQLLIKYGCIWLLPIFNYNFLSDIAHH